MEKTNQALCWALGILFPIWSWAAGPAVYNPPELKYPQANTADAQHSNATGQERELASTQAPAPAPSSAQPRAKDPAAARFELPNKDEVERNIASSSKQGVKEDHQQIQGLSSFQEVMIETPQNWPWDK